MCLFISGWDLPIAPEDIPDESVVKDVGGIATLLNPDGPTPELPGTPHGTPDVEEETDPEPHCVEVALRTCGTEPTLDSESGQLMLLKVARVV